MPSDDHTLDPDDWAAFANRAHDMLDAALTQMQAGAQGRVWTPTPDHIKSGLAVPLSPEGRGAAVDDDLHALLPYGVGNTHPRFFGWVHGSGTPSNILADMVAAAMNANLGGRDHAAIYVENQLVKWVIDLFGFPQSSHGLVVSGTSIATLIALKTARDKALGFKTRKAGIGDAQLVGYTSTQTHSCVARTFDILGIGADGLRKIPVNAAFEMDTDALRQTIAEDQAAGLTPFAVIGSAGTVNVGAIDDLTTIADIAKDTGLWFHVDGAFGATAVLSKSHAHLLAGLERADSIAFDFHKWLHVNYDAGFVLMRSEADHRQTFSERPDYLKGADRGLAAGNAWPTEYGPELSRGFRALKIWQQLAEHGPDKLGKLIAQNCDQAAYLAAQVDDTPDLERLAPVTLGICCFRYIGGTPDRYDAINGEIVIQLQEQGIAAPSTTLINGQNAIRVNITNHRTRQSDLDILIAAVREIGATLV